MSKAAELAALIGSQTALSNRNLVINGAMQVAQRGTSATALGNGNSGYHTVDRWRFTEAGAGTYQFTMSQSTTAPEGFASSLKLDCTTAQTSLDSDLQLRLMHRIEGQNLQHLKFGTSSAESFTVSFWVRSNLTGTYVVHIFLADDSVSASKTYTIDAANTWEHKTITFSGDQTSVIDNDNGIGVQVSFYLLAGTDYTTGTSNTEFSDSATTVDRAAGQTVNLASSTSNDWYVTGIQLEVGEQATPFEHRSYGDELARCKRYYQRWEHTGTDATSNKALGAGLWYTATSVLGSFSYDKEMRAAPTVVTSGTDFCKAYSPGASTPRSGGGGLDSIGLGSARFFFDVGTSRTAGDGAYIQLNSSGDFLALDAEL